MPVRMLKKDEDTKREKGLKKSKMLSGGQVKLDKNKDGKISGEDFKMMSKKNQGGMMAKSTRGYGAARTSGMGLQDEQVKPGKVQKAALGAIALGIGLKKLMDKKGKGLPPGLGAAALISKKKKDILGKKEGGISKKPKLGDLGSRFTKAELGKLKQQYNRFKNKSTKGGGADESKRMSDKTRTNIKNILKNAGRLSPARSAVDGAKSLYDNTAGKIFNKLKNKIKNKAARPFKKMGGGMMMKQYNKGGSVTAGCKLGRNKATKLY